MIVTVTPAPAIDWTVTVGSFELDAVNRIQTSVKEPSGKGVNVSWALHRAGVATTAVFPGGGDTGRFMDDALSAAGVPFVRVESDREVRTNITLISPGHATKVNESGQMLDHDVVHRLTQQVLDAADETTTVLICGSLPPGVEPDYPKILVEQLVARGARVGLDTSGEPLTLALSARPRLIKPNVHELAELVDAELRTFADVVAAAREAMRRGAGSVLASLGADGALFVGTEEVLVAKATGTPFVNSVGAGDALLAGFVAVEGTPATRLHNAVLWASSAVAHNSTLFPVRHEFGSQITVGELEGDLPLTEPSLPLSSTDAPAHAAT